MNRHPVINKEPTPSSNEAFLAGKNSQKCNKLKVTHANGIPFRLTPILLVINKNIRSTKVQISFI